jgi:hypothetical protein
MNPDQQKLVEACEDAAQQLEAADQPHRAMAAGALPGWLGTILTEAVKVFGPQLAAAAIKFLEQYAPKSREA